MHTKAHSLPLRTFPLNSRSFVFMKFPSGTYGGCRGKTKITSSLSYKITRSHFPSYTNNSWHIYVPSKFNYCRVKRYGVQPFEAFNTLISNSPTTNRQYHLHQPQFSCYTKITPSLAFRQQKTKQKTSAYGMGRGLRNVNGGGGT